MVFTVAFDHPLGGIRIEKPPNFDTREHYTIQNFMLATTGGGPIYSLVPPYTPPGTYLLRRDTDAVFQRWMRLSVINADTVSHTCLAYGYQVALKRKRSEV